MNRTTYTCESEWGDISHDELLKEIEDAYDKLKPVVEEREKLQKMVNENPLLFWLNRIVCVEWGIYPQIEYKQLELEPKTMLRWLNSEYYGILTIRVDVSRL